MQIIVNGNTVNATEQQASVIEKLKNLHAGGFATIKRYIPSTGYTVRPVVDYLFISNFSIAKLYQRRIAALEALKFSDIPYDDVMGAPKLVNLSDDDLRDLFEKRKTFEINSMQKTLDGVRNDARRAAHDRNYIKLNGCKLNLVTEKNDDGLSVPVAGDGGHYTVASILVPAIVLNTVTVKAGERKMVNSGAPVQMSNLIKRTLKGRTIEMKQFSLKPDNFESLQVSGEVVKRHDLVDLAA